MRPTFISLCLRFLLALLLLPLASAATAPRPNGCASLNQTLTETCCDMPKVKGEHFQNGTLVACHTMSLTAFAICVDQVEAAEPGSVPRWEDGALIICSVLPGTVSAGVRVDSRPLAAVGVGLLGMLALGFF